MNYLSKCLYSYFHCSPSTSHDLEADLSQNYREAEKVGSSSGDCTIYDCNFSIMELISKTFKIN